MISDAYKYSRNHMWVRFKRDRVVIGATENLLEGVDEVFLLSLPKVGEEISQDDIFGTVETNKDVLDLVAPVSGEVVRVNSLIKEEPELLIEDPYGDGWILEVEYYNEEEFEALLDAEEYEAIKE